MYRQTYQKQGLILESYRILGWTNVTLVLWDISKTIRVSPLTCLNSVRCSDAVPPSLPAQPIVIRNPREQVSAVCSPHFSDHDNPSAKSKKAPLDPRGEILHILQIYWYEIRGHLFLFDSVDTGDNCIQFLSDLAPGRNNSIIHMSGNILRNYKTSFES